MTETGPAKKKRKLSRREFLIALGVTGGGLLLGTRIGLPFARLKVAEVFDSEAFFNSLT